MPTRMVKPNFGCVCMGHGDVGFRTLYGAWPLSFWHCSFTLLSSHHELSEFYHILPSPCFCFAANPPWIESSETMSQLKYRLLYVSGVNCFIPIEKPTNTQTEWKSVRNQWYNLNYVSFLKLAGILEDSNVMWSVHFYF